jgi:putative flippase GtrA
VLQNPKKSMPNSVTAQFSRYVLSGLIATFANTAAFTLVRWFAPFTFAVLCGAVAGVVTSMVLTSSFVFSTGRILPQGKRLARFLMVHGAVVVIILVVSNVSLRLMLLPADGALADLQQVKVLWVRLPDFLAFCTGVAVATPVGFFLHRSFTYSASNS